VKSRRTQALLGQGIDDGLTADAGSQRRLDIVEDFARVCDHGAMFVALGQRLQSATHFVACHRDARVEKRSKSI